MQKLLCVEDSPETVLILEATLKGYAVTFANTVSHATQYLRDEKYDLMLLDIELPDGDGNDLCENLPEHNGQMPIMFLTSRKDFSAKATAFALGAEDYIQKPFDPRELRLRIDSKLKRLMRQHSEAQRLTFGKTTLNLLEQRVHGPGHSGKNAIDLTKLEFKILWLLARTPNKIFSRNEIVERVWGAETAITERAVDVHVSNARRKLQTTDVDIEAVIGSGYRLLIRKS